MTVDGASERIVCLDHIRGLAILGILMVNAIAFAQPMDAYNDPSVSLVPLSHADTDTWWLTEVFFREKFVTTFTMLFGVSVFLVGRGQEAGIAAYKTPLFRRLAWLALFGLIHGALIWHGDILLSYAVTGFAFWPWRHASARLLIGFGALLFGVGSVLLLAPMVYMSDAMQANVGDIGAIVAQMRSGLAGSLQGNFDEWTATVIPELINFLPTTLGLMMVGAGLFKAGVLNGRAATRLYLGLIAAGVLSLAAIAFQASQIVTSHFRFPDAYGVYQIANTLLCPLVALGYAGVLILVGRTGAGKMLLYPLACAGRMAFTNYLTQSLIMTALFYGGRGPAGYGLPLFGQMNAAALTPIVVAIWAGQLVVSTVWMSVLRYGPFEWVWRCLTYQRWVGILRSTPPAAGPSAP